MSPPKQAPTDQDLLAHSTVQVALAEAWLDSQASDPVARHEEGGWIYMDLSTGDISVQRAARGMTDNIDLGNPPTVLGSVVVGTFHTHPNPTSEGWFPGPSPADQRWAQVSGVPWLIQADDGTHTTGPVSRRGGLAGVPGYPQ